MTSQPTTSSIQASEETWSQKVEELDSSYDIAIEDAMHSAVEAGLNEDTNREAFWHFVYVQAINVVDAEN